MSLFVGQSKVTLSLDTKIDLSGATLKQIKYVKPNGVKGAWNASNTGTTLTYLLQTTDLDVSGRWQLQAYVEFGSDKSYGDIVFQDVFLPLG